MTSLLDFTAQYHGSLRRVPVLLPVALDQTYDYLAPDGFELEPGAFILVPFGSQQRIGVVWDQPRGPEKEVAEAKLKAVTERLDVPALPPQSLRLAEWVARYTLSPLGMVLRMMMGAQAVFEPVKPRFGVRLCPGIAEPARMTPARRRALEVAGDGLIRAKTALATEAGCSTGVVDGLVEAGLLIEVAIPDRRYPTPNPAHSKVEFGSAQQASVVALLDGVPGSGKTEVYFEAVARALERGRQALIMLPEIALTGQFTSRFEKRFGCSPVEWHSALASAERGRVWRSVATGEARVVVGARSALFLPYGSLGMIVVDEEHDQGYKQDDRVHYQARDMAVVRGNIAQCAVVLASATPSLESHVNARTGRYRHLILPGRYSGVELPDVTPVDLRKHPPDKGNWLSPVLVEATKETLAKGQQTLLFLNRRGYAPLTLCRTCGHRIECPQCTAWLVEHRFRNRLNCHHCGFSLPLPEKCPKCGERSSLVACGPGVERIAEEVAERFPDARVTLLSSDLVPGLTEMREIMRRIEGGEIDIIIGTQIVAKGHHFPNLATVGVVDGDLGLGQADPRAAERTFQLLHQVTGRAGRAFAQGRGFVQTYMPEPRARGAAASGRDAAAFRPAGGAHHFNQAQGAGGDVCARRRAPRPSFEIDRGVGAGRGAARRHSRPASMADPGQGIAGARHAGLLAIVAGSHSGAAR